LTSSAEIIDSGENTSFDADDMIRLFYSLKTPYSRNGAWMLNRQTLGYVRQLKAGDDNYLWQPGLATLAPATILGQPYVEAPDLVAPVAGAFTDGDKPIIFGDFARGYTILTKAGMRMVRDSVTTDSGVNFKFYLRVGGAVVNPEAIKIMRTT
jgi:HK97 family phage major capsid protein